MTTCRTSWDFSTVPNVIKNRSSLRIIQSDLRNYKKLPFGNKTSCCVKSIRQINFSIKVKWLSINFSNLDENIFEYFPDYAIFGITYMWISWRFPDSVNRQNAKTQIEFDLKMSLAGCWLQLQFFGCSCSCSFASLTTCRAHFVYTFFVSWS